MQSIRTNLVNTAPSQYTNFDFLSMVECHGVILGAGTTGLHKICCGDDDNGVDIDAYFVTAKSDLGMGRKRIKYAYFGYSGATDMEISLTADDETTIGPYTITAEATEGTQKRRTSFGRGLKWNYGYFTVANVDGGDFSLDFIDVEVFDVAGGK